MKRQNLIGLFLLAVFCVAPVFSQNKNEKPNFSGTWILDESKSNKALKALFKSSKNNPNLNSNEKTIHKLVIEHSEPEIKVAEIITTKSFDENGKSIKKAEKTLPSQTYYTDKRGEQNVNEKNQPFNSISKWNDKKIFVVIPDKKENRTSVMQLSLSKDGKELTVNYESFKSTRGGVVSPLGFGNRVFNKSN